MATIQQIDTVRKHFLIACLWADCEESTSPRIPGVSQRVASGICKAFIDANLDLFNRAMECHENGYGAHPDAGSAEAAFGHDLWLTSQGHGVGFWDRDELGETLGEELTEALRQFQNTINISCEQYRGWMYVRAWDRTALVNRFE